MMVDLYPIGTAITLLGGILAYWLKSKIWLKILSTVTALVAIIWYLTTSSLGMEGTFPEYPLIRSGVLLLFAILFAIWAMSIEERGKK